MKYILIIDDGCADNPVEKLGNKTPLEYAKKPNLDALAAKGIVGNTLNVPHGLPAGSDLLALDRGNGGGKLETAGLLRKKDICKGCLGRLGPLTVNYAQRG